MAITINFSCRWCEYKSDLTLVRKHEDIIHPNAVQAFNDEKCWAPCRRNACFDGCGYPPIVFDDGTVLQTVLERISLSGNLGNSAG